MIIQIRNGIIQNLTEQKVVSLPSKIEFVLFLVIFDHNLNKKLKNHLLPHMSECCRCCHSTVRAFQYPPQACQDCHS